MIRAVMGALAAGLAPLAVSAPAPSAQGGRSAAAGSVLATNAIIGPLTTLAGQHEKQTGAGVRLAFETSPNIARSARETVRCCVGASKCLGVA